jgi:hypothetical protein
MLKSLVHGALHNKLDHEERGRLAGYINWAASVEPAFLEALARKYGRTAIADLRKYTPRT